MPPLGRPRALGLVTVACVVGSLATWAESGRNMINLLFIFGSLAVLLPQDIVPCQELLVWEEAEILGSVGAAVRKTLFPPAKAPRYGPTHRIRPG